MSYIDQERPSRRIAIGGVVLLHIVIGYALISGFAITVITGGDRPTWVEDYKDPPPPPRHDPPPPQHRPPVARDPAPDDTIIKVGAGPGDGITKDPPIPYYPPFQPPQVPQQQIVSHAHAPIPGSGRAGWVTTDDYPGAALRDEVQGVVGIDVTVGMDGRVSACSVTASSGSDVLDQATCRLYARRARFQSALDDDGKATVGHYADRICWTIPQQ